MDTPDLANPEPSSPPALPVPGGSAPQPKLPKSPGLALLLSFFFPGIGQVYNGQPAKAFVFFFGVAGSIYATAVINPLPFAFLIPFAYFYNLVDAYRSAVLINAGPAGRTSAEAEVAESPAWGITLIVLGLVFLMQNLGWINLAALHRYWPLLLVAAGAFFLYGSIQKRKETGDAGRL